MNIAATAISLFLDASQQGSSSSGCAGGVASLASSLLGAKTAASQDPLAGIIGQFTGGNGGSGDGLGSLLGVATSIAGMLA